MTLIVKSLRKCSPCRAVSPFGGGEAFAYEHSPGPGVAGLSRHARSSTVVVRFNVTRGYPRPHHNRSVQGFRPPHVPAVSPGLSAFSSGLYSGTQLDDLRPGQPLRVGIFTSHFCQVPVTYFALSLHPMELGSVSSGRTPALFNTGPPSLSPVLPFALLQRVTWGNYFRSPPSSRNGRIRLPRTSSSRIRV